MKKFEFQEKGHKYFLDGKPLTGCTTILGVIAKPMLIQWAANMAVDHIVSALPMKPLNPEKSKWEINWSDFLLITEEARKEHAKKKEKAGDWGTALHAWVESYILHRMNDTVPFPEYPKDDELKRMAREHFIIWAENNKVEFVESEKCVYSESLFLGGKLDIICIIDGKKWLVDVKTGSGIYPEHFAQMAGYDFMLKEMKEHEDIEGYIVLNIKKDGTFEEKRSISNEDNRKFFLACVEIYRLQAKLKGSII